MEHGIWLQCDRRGQAEVVEHNGNLPARLFHRYRAVLLHGVPYAVVVDGVSETAQIETGAVLHKDRIGHRADPGEKQTIRNRHCQSGKGEDFIWSQ